MESISKANHTPSPAGYPSPPLSSPAGLSFVTESEDTMSVSSVSRTMRQLRSEGAVCAKVEKWNPHVGTHGIRQDLFGFGDIIVLDPERGVGLIQCCTNTHAAHLRKITQERTEEVVAWLNTPGTWLQLWTWRKLKLKRGGKARRWMPRIEEITLEDHFEIETPFDEED